MEFELKWEKIFRINRFFFGFLVKLFFVSVITSKDFYISFFDFFLWNVLNWVWGGLREFFVNLMIFFLFLIIRVFWFIVCDYDFSI